MVRAEVIVRKRTGLQLFAVLFFMLFSSCTSVPPLRDTGGSVPCPESFSSVRLIKDYISQMRSVNPFLQGIYDRLLSGIFRDALDSLDLGECPVSRMYEWINFCRGLLKTLVQPHLLTVTRIPGDTILCFSLTTALRFLLRA